MRTMTAEQLFDDLKTMPVNERSRFFTLLTSNAFGDENATHEQVFGHLATAELTAQEAAEYLEVSMSTFRRYVSDGKIKASSELGRNQLYAASELKMFKRALKEVKRSARK
ncbi:helix-turn-helix domain-containing protein [Glaciimonas sp. PCH181]|uniref:helix-turn-helix domain-containing protein n=1 Tax=Glaciimonas sp. PCH181 TaxID=2133943 RepID=UPI000D3CB38A|nr:helix-turn-helix domain-containing protein [Glaciimonas sp. PCH181]PUA18942.1 DNA-binding protein [Glaciimonas sp. PCH181]